MSEPRVWVGCLSCYNEGRLVGEWASALEAPEVIPCQRPNHEEWWCMDHEGFLGALDGECSPEEAAKIATALAEFDGGDDQVVAAWLADGHPVGRPDLFQDEFRGVFNSEREFAYQLADDLGFQPSTVWPATHVDWEAATGELFTHDFWSARVDGGVAVFSRY